MKLPLDLYGEPDTQAIEYLLTVHEFLELLYLASMPNQTSIRVGVPDHLSDFRSVKKFLDWGLVTIRHAPQPGYPDRHSQTLTASGEKLARSYASEVSRLLQLRAERSASPPPAA